MVLAVRLPAGDLTWMAQDLGAPLRVDLNQLRASPEGTAFALGLPRPLGDYGLSSGALTAGAPEDPQIEPEAILRARLEDRTWIDSTSPDLPLEVTAFRPARHLPGPPDICGKRRHELHEGEIPGFAAGFSEGVFLSLASGEVRKLQRNGLDVTSDVEPDLTAIERAEGIAMMTRRTLSGSFWVVTRTGDVRHWPGSPAPMGSSPLAADAVDGVSEDLSTVWITTASGRLLLLKDSVIHVVSSAAMTSSATIPRVVLENQEAFAIQVGSGEAIVHAKLDGTFVEERPDYPLDRPFRTLTSIGRAANAGVFVAAMVSADGSRMNARSLIFHRERDGSWRRLDFELGAIVAGLADLDGTNLGYSGWSQATLFSIAGAAGSFGPTGAPISCGLGTSNFTHLFRTKNDDVILVRAGPYADQFGPRPAAVYWTLP